MHAAVRQRLLEFSDFLQEKGLGYFTNITIKDIILSGSICSYIYNDATDIDFLLVIDDIFPDNKELSQNILNKIIFYIVSRSYHPYFFGHPSDYGILFADNPKNNTFNSYSVLNNCWRQKPHRQEFSFSAEDLYEAYREYSQKLHQFVAQLEKINNAFLTMDSCRLLQSYLQDLRLKAFDAKENSLEHEYSLDYNLYRLLKKFGTYRHFQQYINVSYKNDIRKK